MMRILRRKDSRLPKAVSDVCFLCVMPSHKLILSLKKLDAYKAAHKGAMHTHLKAKDAYIQVHHAHKSMAIQHEFYATGLRAPLD